MTPYLILIVDIPLNAILNRNLEPKVVGAKTNCWVLDIEIDCPGRVEGMKREILCRERGIKPAFLVFPASVLNITPSSLSYVIMPICVWHSLPETIPNIIKCNIYTET